MFLLKQILPAAIVAMMVAAGICSLAFLWRKDRAHAVLGPLALGVAYFAGHVFIAGWVRFPPVDTTNWLPFFALATAVLGAFCGVLTISPWMRVLIFALISAGALRLLLNPKFQYSWSLGEGWIRVAGLAAGMVLLAVILDALVRRRSEAVDMPVFLLIASAGIFGALMLSGSMLLGQFATVLTAAIFGGLVLAARSVVLSRGIVPVFSLVASALLISGCFFAELPAASAALLAFAPAFALIPIGPRNKLFALVIRGALVSVPVVVALFLAFHSSPPLDY